MIIHRGDKWILYSHDGSKVLGEHDTEAEAQAQEAAVNIAKAREAGHKIPRKDAVTRLDAGELAKPERMANGWVRVDAFISRTGVQEYRRADGTAWRELRTAEEVFSQDSLGSFEHVPLTDEHPPGGRLDAENTKLYQVGTVGTPARDGDKARARILVTDHATVAAMEAGKAEVSCGYVCDLDFEPGVTADGQRYDAIQRNIRGNHVALTKIGRAGPEVRVRMDSFDAEVVASKEIPGREKVRMAKVKIDAVDYEVPDQVAQALEKERSSQAAALKSAQEAGEKDKARADAAEAAAAKDKARAEAAPAQAREAIKARVALEGQARKVLGAEAKLDALSDVELKRSVAEKQLGMKLEGKPDAYVDASFEIAMKHADEAPGAFGQPGTTAPIRTDGAGTEPDADAAKAKFLEASRKAYLPKA